jgi:tRNA A37 threonylcarbamoyladenosine biosynthesis protein TsaE
LDDAGILSHEFDETLHDEKSVVVIEWAATVKGVLPKDRAIISFKPVGDESRKLEITTPKSLRYISDAYTEYKNQ